MTESRPTPIVHGRAAVLSVLLRGGGFGQVQPDVCAGEDDPGDVGRLGRKVGFGCFQGEFPGGDAHVHARQRVLVVGGEVFQCEVPDDDLFPDQRPQGRVEREFIAAQERVGFVDQQGVVDRQPQREGEADALDRQIHPEGAGCIIDRPAPDQVLDRGDIEQRGDQQQHDEQDKQCPERIFEYLFQHLRKFPVS